MNFVPPETENKFLDSVPKCLCFVSEDEQTQNHLQSLHVQTTHEILIYCTTTVMHIHVPFKQVTHAAKGDAHFETIFIPFVCPTPQVEAHYLFVHPKSLMNLY